MHLCFCVSVQLGTSTDWHVVELQGKRYGSGSVDEQVMGRLGEVIGGMKDDFIVVHLQEPCSLCREYISDGPRYGHTQVIHSSNTLK